MPDDDKGYELAMRFVTVVSNGGPHDDSSYVHGYEMGKLDATLDPALRLYHEATLHTENLPQADLIAMRNGYTMELITTDGDWVEVAFTSIYEQEQ